MYKFKPDIIRNRNYPVEIHNVTTSDGYILELHRIPPKVRSDGHQPKVVYFQPGFMATSGSGLIRGSGSNRTTNGSLSNL